MNFTAPFSNVPPLKRTQITQRSAIAILLAGAIGACAGSEQLDGLENDEVEIEEVSQALNGDSVELMKLNNSRGYHKQWFTGTRWTQFNPSATPARFNEFTNGVEGAMVGRNTHWVEFGSAIFHNERDSLTGNWANPSGNWSETPGSRSWALSYKDVGLAEVDNGLGSTELHVCAVLGSSILHQIRRADGTWTSLSHVSARPTNHQTLNSVDCVRDGRDLRVFYTNAGSVHELRRFANNQWAYQGQLPRLPGADVARVAVANLDGNIQLAAVSSSGGLYRRVGGANVTGPWTVVPGQDVARWKDVSLADVQGLLHVVALTSDGFYIRHSLGTPFGFTPFNVVVDDSGTASAAANISIAASKF